MDSITNEELSARKQKADKRTFRIQLGKFQAEIGDDVAWYWDIRLWAPVLVVLFILALLPGKKVEAPAAPQPAQDVQMLVEQTEPAPVEAAPVVTEPVRDEEAEALARLADTVGSGRTDNVKLVIMWLAVNRSEDRANGFGKSLIEEIDRENQWQFYDPNAPYGEGTYMLAEGVLKTARSNGLRPVEKDMLWLVLNDDGSVTIRNQFRFNSKSNCVQKTYK